MNAKELNVISLLNSARVAFAVIGAHAVRFYGCDRPTQDLDILFLPTRKNADLLYPILKDLGAEDDIQKRYLEMNGQRFPVNHEGLQIDFLTSVSDIPTALLLENMECGTEDGVEVPYISKSNLICVKRASAKDAEKRYEKEMKDVKCLDPEVGVCDGRRGGTL